MHKNNSVLRSCKCQLGDKLNYYVSLEEVFSPPLVFQDKDTTVDIWTAATR